MIPKRAASPVVVMIAAVGLAACSAAGAPAQSTSASALRPGSAGPTVYTFGVVGSLGAITALQHDTPTPVAGIKGTVVQIASSNSDGYALTSAGTVWAWGAGAYGELGNGTTPEDVTTAVRVDFPAGVKITSLPNPMPFDAGLAITPMATCGDGASIPSMSCACRRWSPCVPRSSR